jgi:hypothetical protein
VNDIKRRQRQKMRHDIRFYRKRVLAVFKDLLLRRDNPVANERVQCAFDEFARVTIEELKTTDTSDIVQTGLNDGDDDGDHETDDENAQTSAERMESQTQSQNTDKIITYANELLVATKATPVTMDKFVIKKSLDEPVIKSVQKRHEQMSKKAPMTKVDLTEPSLRTKGVPPKKENVNSSYDKTNGQAEQAKPQTDAKKSKRRKKQADDGEAGVKDA